jgi:hypothetical protein
MPVSSAAPSPVAPAHDARGDETYGPDHRLDVIGARKGALEVVRRAEPTHGERHAEPVGRSSRP